jgi:hypothetical protein
MSENQGLREYYEGQGFREAGEVTGETVHPHGATERTGWRATLYERPITPP